MCSPCIWSKGAICLWQQRDTYSTAWSQEYKKIKIYVSETTNSVICYASDMLYNDSVCFLVWGTHVVNCPSDIGDQMVVRYEVLHHDI